MPVTYENLATTTLGSAQSDITFASISGSFTDLILVINSGSSVGVDVDFRLNDDTGANYSRTTLGGNGTSALSGRVSGETFGRLSYQAYSDGGAGNTITIGHFMNYSNTTTNKTILSRSSNAGRGTDAVVNLWRSTSAITKILITTRSASTFAAGSTFTLYGIKAA